VQRALEQAIKQQRPKEYEVTAWFLVKAKNEDEAIEKVRNDVIGGRPSLGDIEDWDTDEVAEREDVDGA
jgi:hypothetical protein